MKRIINKSDKGIPEELYEALIAGNLDEANNICDEYNLKIFEIERIDDETTYTVTNRQKCKK